MVNFTNLSKTEKRYLLQTIYGACMHGYCYIFAIALHRALGWPIMGILDDDGKSIWHAVVMQPDNQLRDVRGPVPLEKLGEPFNKKPPYALVEVTEEDLRARDPNITDLAIESLQQKAEAIWPELPWPKSSLRQKTESFLVELEALSRKHGFWIRGSIPAHLPVLSPEDGRETGYIARPTPTGSEFFLNRSFGHADEVVQTHLSEFIEFEELGLD